MSEEEAESLGNNAPRILRGRVASFALYEITDSELNTLESGSPSSIHLNLAIFFLSVAVSFLTSLITSSVSPNVFTVFVALTVVGFAVGGSLFVFWWKARQSVTAVVNRIRARIPGESSGLTGEQASK